MSHFDWKILQKPFFALAPMEGATDAAFRQLLCAVGRPDVFFTEFVNVEGMMSQGKRQVEQSLFFEPVEQPLIAQVWGLEPTNFFEAAARVVDLGFAGIDINMGCPDRAVIKKGTGGALVNNPSLAAKIIAAVKSGVAGRIPVSVKIRTGFDEVVTQSWVRFILEQGIDALTIHGRTVKQLSKVPADWEQIGLAVQIRDEMKLPTVIMGNGDVASLDQGRLLAEQYGVDGIMIGRGVFYNPGVFVEKESGTFSRQERIGLLTDHAALYKRIFGDTKPYDPLKRYIKIYIQQFDGAAYWRDRLMQTRSIEELNIQLEIMLAEEKE
jgi:tRNA-dihydrouridine synthase